MNEPRDPTRSRWAPWWAYVVPIVVLNYLRIALVPPGEVGDAASVALFVATTIVVAAVVTVLHRARGHAPG